MSNPSIPENPSAGWQQQQPAPKKKHTARNVFIVIGVVLVLMVGGCVALLGSAANEVDKAVTRGETEEGGTNNPKTIKAGKAFEVRGFQYAAGWKVTDDGIGDVQISGLKVTNKRAKRDSAVVEIKFWKGSEVLALVDCSTEPILADTTTKLTCTSSDPKPKKYDKITISDSF